MALPWCNFRGQAKAMHEKMKPSASCCKGLQPVARIIILDRLAFPAKVRSVGPGAGWLGPTTPPPPCTTRSALHDQRGTNLLSRRDCSALLCNFGSFPDFYDLDGTCVGACLRRNLHESVLRHCGRRRQYSCYLR